jgi:hypothetical protein
MEKAVRQREREVERDKGEEEKKRLTDR